MSTLHKELYEKMFGTRVVNVLIICFVATTIGQSCYKRFVKGKWVSNGNCEGQEKHQSITNEIASKVKTHATQKSHPTSCHNINLKTAKSTNKTGGVFDINIAKLGVTEVYCDVTTDGGNWIVFQRNDAGNLDFNRNWIDYVNGFGDPRGEFWLGLEAIHQLTRNGDCEMRIDMSWRQFVFYVKYSSFAVGPASSNYTLNLSGHSGTLQDGLSWNNNQSFSARDRDNDLDANNCAVNYGSGWWYDNCKSSRLNGLIQWTYQRLESGSTIGRAVSFTEMKLRVKTENRFL